MTRDELFASIVAAGPGRDDLVYLERCGDAYHWRLLTGAEIPSPATAPDVWMSFSAAWPLDEPARLRAFFDDLFSNPAYQPLDVTPEQIFAADDMTFTRDPFDALICASAQTLGMPLITRDAQIRASGAVKVIW